MTEADIRRQLAEWARRHSTALPGLDPDDRALDALEPLREIVGGARVVAIGEGCHFVEEFTRARALLLRFLHERCGFDVLAFEFGFAEGFPLDKWLRGHGTEEALTELRGTPNAGANGPLLRWLRRYNAAAARPIRFAGLDLPVAGGELRPALEPVREHLAATHPDSTPLVDRALAIADRFTGASVAVAAPRWARLETGEQDALTAALTRLRLRMGALEDLLVRRGDRAGYDRAVRQLDAALHTEHMFRAFNELFAGTGAEGDVTVRERFMAESLRWHLDRAEPGTRVVLAAHNTHVQKTPVQHGGELNALPLGQHLAQWFGDDYRALALTHTGARVPDMEPDGSADTGFRLVDTAMGPPGAGSPEAALHDAGLADRVALADLRGSPRGQDGKPLLDRMRAQGQELPIPVPDAFDGVLCAPTATTRFTASFE